MGFFLHQKVLAKDEEPDQFDGMFAARLRSRIWNTFEDPNSSPTAKGLVIFTSVFLMSSICMLILSTLPEFQETNSNGKEEEVYFFRVTEAVFVAWFTLEFFVR